MEKWFSGRDCSAACRTWAADYRRFWEESFDKLDVLVNQMKNMEIKDGKKHG